MVLLLRWLERDPEFEITLGNAPSLLRSAKLYLISSLEREVMNFLSLQPPSFELYCSAVNAKLEALEGKHRDWIFHRMVEFLDKGYLSQLTTRNVRAWPAFY